MILARHDSVVESTPWRGIVSVRTRTAYEYPKHWHDTFGLGVMVRGAHRSASGRGSVEAYAGDVITSNPGEIHDGRPLGGSVRSWCMLCIDHAAMGAAIGREPAQRIDAMELDRPVIRDPRLSRIVARLFLRIDRWRSRVARGNADTTACDESLAEACSLLLEPRGAMPNEMGASQADMNRVRDRLRDELHRPPPLDELAAMAGLSKFQLVRRFERSYGLPPHAWLMQCRAERARTLIRQGASLAGAAEQSGFTDQSHMTRAFVRQFRFTPGAWRRAVSGTRG